MNVKGKENPKHQKGIDTMATNIEKKITKQMKLSAIIDYFKDMEADATVDLATIKVDGQEQEVPITVQHIIDFAQHEVELLGKKKSGSATKGEDELATAILAYMEQNPTLLMTTTDLIKNCPACEGLNTQKVAPRLSNLEKAGLVVKSKEKGKTIWQYAGE